MKAVPLVVAVLLVALASTQVTGHNIKHVVVLMMENRSFDHMLGYLKFDRPEVNGLNGTERNFYNTSDPHSGFITVDDQAPYSQPNPGHSITATAEQLFGYAPQTGVPPMSGFVQNMEKEIPGKGRTPMSMFSPKSAPIIHQLANEFALFDRWFSAVPGPTQVNRMFAVSATSYGSCINTNYTQIIEGYPQKTIFESLDEGGKDWKIYWSDLPATLFHKYTRKLSSLARMQYIDQFYKDAAAGTLPAYSWLEPRYFESFGQLANDQHPDHDVADGEKLIKQVYEAVRASPAWEETLFLITYDEHGGFYDHVPPPTKDVPSPDGRYCLKPKFDFTRLGVRVPTIAISPWIPKGLLVTKPKGPDVTSEFEHSSLPATVKKLFNLPGFLNHRDAWAGTFEHILSLASPRIDAPKKLAVPKVFRTRIPTGLNRMSDLEEMLVELAAATMAEPVVPQFETEAQGAAYVEGVMAELKTKAALAGFPDA